MEAEKTNKPISSFDLFGKSMDIVMRNLSNFVVLNLLPAAVLLGSMIASHHGSSRSGDFASLGGASGVPTYAVAGLAGFGVVIVLVVVIASTIIRAMLYGLQLEGARGKTPDMSALWQVGKKYWLRLFALSIVIGLAIVGGLILLIVPGLIMIRRYFLAPYVMVDKNTGILDSMRQSAALSKPYSGSVWGVIGVSVLLSVPGVIPIIGSFISLALGVLYSVAPALRYEELKKLPKTT